MFIAYECEDCHARFELRPAVEDAETACSRVGEVDAGVIEHSRNCRGLWREVEDA